VLKHYIIAAVELVSYAVLWFVLGGVVASSLAQGDTMGVIVGMVFLAGFLALFHIGDAVVTYFVAKKGLHPRRQRTPAFASDGVLESPAPVG
jgi:hypothetical protein